MKKLYLVISTVVILAIVCSPCLAVSKADLISQYKGQSSPTIPIPTPTPTPTSTPTLSDGWLLANSTPTRSMVFVDGSYRGLTPIRIYGLSVGTHQLRLSRAGYEDYSTEFVMPEASCYPSYGGSLACHIGTITIDATLKKVESIQKPTIPTVVPTTAPIQTPIPTPYKPAWLPEGWIPEDAGGMAASGRFWANPTSPFWVVVGP